MPGSEPVSAENMSQEGKKIEKPNPHDAATEVMQANRMVQEERRNAERRVAAEKDRARQEIERIRADADRKSSDLIAERKVLLRTIAQLQSENETLERDIIFIKAKLEAVEWVKRGLVPQTPASATGVEEPGHAGGMPLSPMPADGIPAPAGSIFRVNGQTLPSSADHRRSP